MMNAVKLSRKYSLDELLAMEEQIRSDPKNKNTVAKSIYLYTPSANKKLESIAWAIYYHLKEQRASGSKAQEPQEGMNHTCNII